MRFKPVVVQPDAARLIETTEGPWFVRFSRGSVSAPPTYAGRWTGADPFHLNIPRVDHA